MITVTRVETEHGSHISPALDPGWSDLQKLEWKVAVVAMDTGLRASVTEVSPGQFALVVGRSSTTLPFAAAWDYLNGAATGAGA